MLLKKRARSSFGSPTPAIGIAGRWIPQARQRRDRTAQLRRQHVGEPFADEDERLAPLLERAHVDDEPLQRRERHLVADELDGLRRIIRVLLLELVLRLVLELAADELVDALGDRVVVAREAQRGQRLERIHQRDHVRGPELVLDEARERRARGHARAAAHVIVVEEDGEQPDVVFGRLGFLVEVGADRARRPVRGRHGAAVQLDELEGFDVPAACRPRSTSKSDCVRSPTFCPFLSETMTSTRTKLMPARKTGCDGWPGGGAVGLLRVRFLLAWPPVAAGTASATGGRRPRRPRAQRRGG